MKDSDGTTTSSPGWRSSSAIARCSAAVQDDTATACCAPTEAVNAASNAATRGPWATQPEARTSATAAASCSPSTGRMTGMTGCDSVGCDSAGCDRTGCDSSDCT